MQNTIPQIKSLIASLRKIPSAQRRGYHQMATRNAGDALMFAKRGLMDVADRKMATAKFQASFVL